MELIRLKEFLGLLNEEALMTTQEVAEQINAAFEKMSKDFFGFRQRELGNEPKRLFRVITDKNYNHGKPVARFRIPVVSSDDAGNSDSNFKKVIDQVWKLRSQGYLFTTPQGGVEPSDFWGKKGDTVTGNVMTFYVAGKE